MKRLFVEPYNPLPKGSWIKQEKLKFNFAMAIVYLSIVGIIIWGLFDPMAFIFLSLPLSAIFFIAQDWTLYLFYRKDIDYIYNTLSNWWYDRELADISPIYREKVMEYLDYRRNGGEQNEIIEKQLTQWREEIAKEREQEYQSNQRAAAAMFHNLEQLEAYREAKNKL